MMYRIVRFYESAGIRRRTIKYVPTLELAQEHCEDPQASSDSCTSKVGKDRTRRIGRWFDGWESVKDGWY